MDRFKLAVVTTCLAVCPLSSTLVWAGQSEEVATTSQVRVGVFDSRAVAMAYLRSEEFNAYLGEVTAESEKAKAAGDDARIKELESKMMAHQQLAHKQVFGTWLVDDVLELIKDKIPEIADLAGVDIIVSKWQIAYQRPEVELTNVTGHFVKLFALDEDDLKAIDEMQKMEPLLLEELEKHE